MRWRRSAAIGIIAGVIVLLFSGSKIAGFGRSVGQGIRESKREVQDNPSNAGSASAPTVSEPPTIHSIR